MATDLAIQKSVCTVQAVLSLFSVLTQSPVLQHTGHDFVLILPFHCEVDEKLH